MAEPSLTCGEASLLSFKDSVPWILVIIGWVVINYQHNRREDRKELYTMVSRVIDRVKTIEEAAINYHSDANHDERLARSIKTNIDSLIYSIRSLNILDDNKRIRMCIELRRAITYNNFDSSSHTSISQDDPFYDELCATTNKFTISLESAYRKKYPIK